MLKFRYMKHHCFIFLALIGFMQPIAAQQNWAAIPCYASFNGENVDKLLVDSLHNELLLYSNDGYTTCNTAYKGLLAYNGSSFHNLDLGINTHNPNPQVGGLMVYDCITYGNRTLFGGGFTTVGTNTLYSKSIALWNGAVWDSFPVHCFSNKLNFSGGGFSGFLKWQGKLWMYGGFDTVGHTISKNLVAFDGNTFTPVPAIPVNYNYPITKMVIYKNKLIAGGAFNEYPSASISRLAMYDGVSWASVGTGVRGSIAGIYDMVVYNDTLYVAGEWPKAAGNAGNNIVKWDGTQLSDAGFGNFCGWGGIRSLAVFKNRLYAFGGFMCAANQKAFGVAYYENGKWTVPQDSIENWGILDAAVYNDNLYVGGGFRSVNGDKSIYNFAKLLCPDFDAATGCLSGIKENSRNRLNLKVYPNPASDKVIVEFDHTLKPEKLSLSNTLGQVVWISRKTDVESARLEIDLSQLPNGIYLLKADNRQGQSVFKIIRE